MKRSICQILSIIVIIAIFFSLSKLVVFVFGVSVLKQTNDYSSEALYTPETGLSYIEPITQDKDAFRTLSIKGWSFISTQWDTSDRYVAVVFENCETLSQYAIRLEPHERPDIKEEYGRVLEETSGYRKYEINSTRHGFGAAFSPLGLPDGYYRVWIYNYENRNVHGLLRTSRMYRIKSGFFKEIESKDIIAAKTIVNTTEISDAVKSNVDLIEPSENTVFTYGWAYIADRESSSDGVILKVKNSQGITSMYKTMPEIREDVAKYFKDYRYYYSGFSAVIPIEAFTEGENQIIPVIGKEHLEMATPFTFIL